MNNQLVAETKDIHNKHPSHPQDLNPQPQQASGHWDRQSSELFIFRRFIKQRTKYPTFLYHLYWLASHTVFYCDSGGPAP
jgi:hypothetical protein